MSFVNQGSLPTKPFLSNKNSSNKSAYLSACLSWRIFFLVFLILFYCIEILWIRPVDGINDDWGMYSTLSGAYLGYPDAHVLFFLYPLSFVLSRLYTLCSFLPWYGLFLHGVQILCLYMIYDRSMQLLQRHGCANAFWKPALTICCILFFIVDLNVLSEAQYTTTAGLAAAAALFCFATTRSTLTVFSFLRGNLPVFFFAWISFSMRQNILYLMLPMAGMLWIAKWIHAYRNGVERRAGKFLGFAGILLIGMGILYALNAIAYSEQEWSDFRQINYYRERIGDFYTWPEYEECADELDGLGISEEDYEYRRSGAPHIGYGMSLEDWEQMHDIARECYLARTSTLDRLKRILKGGLSVFLYEDGMQPANLLAAILIVLTFLLILKKRNYSALTVYLLYLTFRLVMQLYSQESSPLTNIAYSYMGQMYIALPLGLMSMYYTLPDGKFLLLAMFIMIWLNDTGAFLVGSMIGKHKLFPRISPNKSWEGFIGGVVFAIASSFVFKYCFPSYFENISIFGLAGMGAVVGAFATWGDLVESLIKRTLGVKDSGKLLPGHGGILDRIDSLLLVIPASLLYLTALVLFT